MSPPLLLLGLPALHFFCAHTPFLSQGYRLTLPASFRTTQAVKVPDNGARLSLQATIKTMSFFAPS